MKKYSYVMPFKYVLTIVAFFSLIPILMFDIRRSNCGNEICALKTTLNISKFPIEILDLIGIIFILIGLWRYLVRFLPINNRVVLEETYCIFPGVLQMFPEKKINYIDIISIEKIVLNTNELIKIYLKNDVTSYIFSNNKTMSSEAFDDLFNELSKKIEDVRNKN